MGNRILDAAVPQAAEVVAKALVRAARRLDVQQKDMARILGVSAASASRLFGGTRTVDLDGKEGELALLFLRMYRSVDAILGGDREKCSAWLHAHNSHLGGKPIDRIRSVEGLTRVTDYLDAMRGKV